MGEQTKIQWADHTCNFWWGCMKVSPGCENCYAETFSKRVGRNIWGPPKTTERWRTKSAWRDILKWEAAAKRDGVRRRVFCQSMSDFFEDHPQLEGWRQEALAILGRLEALDVLLLTKRIENVMRMVPNEWLYSWPAHVWLGTSVENQEYADKRIPELINVPAKIRFLSCEPLLGDLDLTGYLGELDFRSTYSYYQTAMGLESNKPIVIEPSPIHWVIVGGESGPGARPMEMWWATEILDQCQDHGVAVFMKQLGSVTAKALGLKDGKGGDIEEFPDHMRIRQFPTSHTL